MHSGVTLSSKYPIALRILHWLMAVIIIGLLIVGLIMADLPKTDPNRALLFSLHKSFGLTVLILAALRLGIRLYEGVPPLPDVIPLIERKLAELGHWSLYGFMLLMPLSGYVMSASFGLPVKWFGVAIPRLVSVDPARGMFANHVHEYAAYLLIAMLVLHVGAVILHYLKHRVNLLRRML